MQLQVSMTVFGAKPSLSQKPPIRGGFGFNRGATRGRKGARDADRVINLTRSLDPKFTSQTTFADKIKMGTMKELDQTAAALPPD